MKVLKFGGTSVGTPAAIQNLKKIVQRQSDDCIVVVSALGGITDQLIRAAHEALLPGEDYEAVYQQIVIRHREMIAAVIAPTEQPTLLDLVNSLLDELRRTLLGVHLLRDLSPKTLATIVSYGERISSLIVTALLPGATHVDACRFIKTQGEATYTLCTEQTEEAVREQLANYGHLTVCPGFIASDHISGEVTNLGRGGSDYTAAILAAALDADVLEIWTDVDGFMTADPREIPSACTIPSLSYQEATELCNFGAKVVYPPTIYPVCAKHIPIRILNTLHPEGTGTVISDLADDSRSAVRGISSIRGVALLTVSGMAMVGVIGVNRRIFSALAEANISVFLVSQASSENSTSLGIQEADCERAAEVLNREFEHEIRIGSINPMTVVRGLAAVSLVGEKMRHSAETTGKLFGILSRENVRVVAFAQGALGMNISLIVQEEVLSRAMNVLHDSFFFGGRRIINLFLCGVGTVGGALLSQIRRQQPILETREKVSLRVVGIANSRHALVSSDGLALDDWQNRLQAAPGSNAQAFAHTARTLDLPGSIFVDCTASPEVAKLYSSLLRSGISVVAANKTAVSGDDAATLHAAALAGGAHFCYETNVGAGLPVVGTIRDMVFTGDRITAIEAVLSGTLNYVCNRLAAGDKLSDAVRQAMEKGYSEPDPRIDLSGEDVRKKLVILSRVAGYDINKDDVCLKPFIPVDSTISREAFLDQLPKLDSTIDGYSRQLRYVASFQADGKAEVGLREVDEYSPYYHLDDAENIVIIHSERYTLPLIVRGFGAGAEVTAAGVFADILTC